VDLDEFDLHREEHDVAQYLILIYEDEAAWESADAGTAARIMGEHRQFVQAHAGALRGGNALEPTATATSVRHDAGGRVTVTDGPFAETKEALGGYYLIEAADLDGALQVAKDVPAPFGGVEIRPTRFIG
jgi:hypothetical protein